MKLDGEKLLADLEDWIRDLNVIAGVEKVSRDLVSLRFTRLKISELETVIDLIKSGKYTIKDKG